jgi:TPP-dependent pyruvate/acetoin dehydrogenase alpha subunit
MLTKDELVEFENEIADLFNAAAIPHPVHLSDGNEEQLIQIFSEVRAGDWVFGSWRAHYHCLLKGVPREEVKAAILSGGSISLSFPEHRILCSAIVGGILPIALGVALSIARSQGSERVYCFLGDMTAETGIFHECRKYALNKGLPIRWVIEDNGMSVMTSTEKAWGRVTDWDREPGGSVYRYRYPSGKWPHAGAGTRVQF